MAEERDRTRARAWLDKHAPGTECPGDLEALAEEFSAVRADTRATQLAVGQTLADEVKRLRDVIKTGGAAYRLERATMGIEGQPIRTFTVGSKVLVPAARGTPDSRLGKIMVVSTRFAVKRADGTVGQFTADQLEHAHHCWEPDCAACVEIDRVLRVGETPVPREVQVLATKHAREAREWDEELSRRDALVARAVPPSGSLASAVAAFKLAMQAGDEDSALGHAMQILPFVESEPFLCLLAAARTLDKADAKEGAGSDEEHSEAECAIWQAAIEWSRATPEAP